MYIHQDTDLMGTKISLISLFMKTAELKQISPPFIQRNAPCPVEKSAKESAVLKI